LDREPKLKVGSKGAKPLYPLNQFPLQTLVGIGKGLLAAKLVRELHDVTGEEWERIFAHALGAEWLPSNFGLDDIRIGITCWGAKTVKHPKPRTAASVRLISGRNSPGYSYGLDQIRTTAPADVGRLVLGIWNARVDQVRQRYLDVRTVVLLKGPGLTENALFETELLPFRAEEFNWEWNEQGNLIGTMADAKKRFTWQPHGAQFTIHEPVPPNRTIIALQPPAGINRPSPEQVIEQMGFAENWLRIERM
jgi:hypothetical protein